MTETKLVDIYNEIKKAKDKYLWDCEYNRLYVPNKISSVKNGWVKAIGFSTSILSLADKIREGKVKIIDDLSKDGMVAKLVTVTLMTRVVVPVGLTDEEIFEKAETRLINSLTINGVENVDSIVDDTDCPEIRTQP